MGAVTGISRALGLLRVLVIAGVLGTTALGNAFQSSNAVSNVVFELVAAGALSAVLVPTFVRLVDRGDDAECARLAGGLVGFVSLALGALSVAGVIGAPWIARVLTTGADPAVAADQRELTTFLLRWFVPQIVLYAFGAVATAVLYARRRFTITAAAPIGNTVVIVGSLALFRWRAGSAPGFALDGVSRALLALAGTGGVVAFVGVLVVACRRAGTPLRPRWIPRDAAVNRLVAHAGWGVLLHSVAGMLLAGALVAGNSVAGGVVAYQSAFVFFLAPYAILAQPLHTAALPELTAASAQGRLDDFGRVLRATILRMTVLVAPATAALMAAALPGMRVVAFGVDGRGVGLLAAGLAALGAGLLPYSLFLLFARALYALGDSRTPALVAVAAGVVGVGTIALGSGRADGAARVAVIGAAHSLAYAAGAVALGFVVARRVRGGLVESRVAPPVLASLLLGGGLWSVLRGLDTSGRGRSIVVLGVAGALVALAYGALMRVVGAWGPAGVRSAR